MCKGIEDLDNMAQVKALLDKKIEAVHKKDAAIILGMYARNIVSFDLKEPMANKGVETIKNRLTEWFASYEDDINQEMQQLEIIADDEVAFSHCLMRTYGTSINGEQQDMWYRTTNGFEKMNGKWMIIHEHSSEPIDLQTGIALFNLKPPNLS